MRRYSHLKNGIAIYKIDVIIAIQLDKFTLLPMYHTCVINIVTLQLATVMLYVHCTVYKITLMLHDCNKSLHVIEEIHLQLIILLQLVCCQAEPVIKQQQLQPYSLTIGEEFKLMWKPQMIFSMYIHIHHHANYIPNKVQY